jgi:hypothetical protein
MSFSNQTIPVFYGWRKKKKKPLSREDVFDIRSKEKTIEEYMRIYQRSKTTIQDIQSERTYSEVE